MDLIDRQEAIDAVIRHLQLDYEYAWGVREAINALPSAEPEQRTGEWLMKPDPYGFFEEIPVCSVCGCTTKWREKYLYCPNCGAKMGGDAK